MPVVNARCPHCARAAHFTPVEFFGMNGGKRTGEYFAPELPETTVMFECVDQEGERSVAWPTRCPGCGRPILVIGATEEPELLPREGPRAVSRDIPTGIRQDLEEAELCYAASAWNASVVMARRALEAGMVRYGAPAANQLRQIDWMRENGHITRTQAGLAHVVRGFGNEAAHRSDDDATGTSKESARAVLDLTHSLLETLFVAKALLERLPPRARKP